MSTFVDAEEPTASVPNATTPSIGSTASTVPALIKTEVTNGSTTAALAPDGYPVDMEIPIRYIKGMEGDRVEARRRWIATLKVK